MELELRGPCTQGFERGFDCRQLEVRMRNIQEDISRVLGHKTATPSAIGFRFKCEFIQCDARSGEALRQIQRNPGTLDGSACFIDDAPADGLRLG
jgi:hypothetical protein